MKAFTACRFEVPLPAGHRFPAAKAARLRDCVRDQVPGISLLEAPDATEEQLTSAHDADYVERALGGRLSAAEQRVIGFPWSPQLIERARRSVGATLAACETALVEGVAIHLGGGTHHAKAASGAGYCVFNDIAVAARTLRQSHSPLRVAVIDLDVHQGDGTAEILAGDSSAFTLSLHGETNFPARKSRSSLDIALPDGTGDERYLEELERALQALQRRFAPQLVVYLAGADPHEDDRLGKLKLTRRGLAQRDRQVYEFAQRLSVPVAVTMAGGYGRDPETTVSIHLQTVQLASEILAAQTLTHGDE